ncbi:MAG: cell surface protein SprA [bacterium]|nr:MAG: cell surface protein SprA [bacterium]
MFGPLHCNECGNSTIRRLWSTPILVFFLAILPAGVAGQTLGVDLLKMSEMLETRYYIAEKGVLPVHVISLGNVGLYPNFLTTDFDFREKRIEYDDETGLVFTVRIPGQYRFLRREDRRGVFYYYTQRDFSTPGLGLELLTLDEYQDRLRMRVRRKIWIDDVKYNLQREREEKTGKGLLSLDIPIKLPKQIERIIGRGEETNLTVQGREKITIGGESRWCANCPQTEGRPRQQKFPDLDMEQQLSVDLHGNIGEKINVGIHHTSQGQGLQSTNRIRINYKGFDDDIIKLIEMGDTDLILSGAQLISYSGAAKGLFGVKAMAQVGPLDLTVIASKEEGETATGTFSASGGQATETKISDYDYIKRQFFYLAYPGESYENLFEGSGAYPYPVIGGSTNDRVEIFLSLRKSEWGSTGLGEYSMKAYADPENNGVEDNIDNGDRPWIGRFKNLIRGEDYELIQIYGGQGNRYVGIELFRRLEDDRSLAIMFRGQRCSGCPVDTIGSYGRFRTEAIGQEDTLAASLICPTFDEFEPDSPTWKMMMRNYYSLGMGQVSAEGLVVKIEIEENRANPDIHVADSSGVSYLRLFGLDRYNRNREFGPDELIDDLPGILNLGRGYIAFPWFEPFNLPEEFINTYIDPGDPKEARFDYSTLLLSDKIYTATTNLERTKGHLYNIIVEASSGQRTFQLAAFDIIEGSDVVTVDGERLSRGTDYDIDYLSGTVTLKGDKLLEMTPDSRVSIDYQHKPLVGGGKSALLGIGAVLNLSKNSRINGTFLYNSEGAPKYNPRLGEEPSRTMAFDINGNLQFNPRWMTSIANFLPRVDTDNQSSLNLNAEVAVSIPNPNVKGEAFIDDMEGIEDSEMINLVRRSWYEASPPLDPSNPEFKLPSADSLDLEFFWYNAARTPQQEYLITSKRDMNPGLDQRENSTLSSIFIRTHEPEPGDWAGIMTGFPGGGIDLTNTQFIEIWVNDFDKYPSDRGGTVHIDFGKIDEDFHQPDSNVFNDEDKPPYTWSRAEEDFGFDGDNPSRVYAIQLDASTWDEDRQVYRWINSRIQNAVHDTEDLNRNGLLNETNSYYTLEFNLADSALIDVRRDFPDSLYWEYYGDETINQRRAWRMYRLDLSKMKLLPSDGSVPRLDAIQHMRIWIENVDSVNGAQGHVLEIAGVKFVGNRWENDGIRDLDGELVAIPPIDMKVKIGMINNKDNPTLYESPYTVQEEEGIANREQSLLFKFEYFDSLSAFQAVKRFFGQGQDYQQYREIQFYVRGKNITEEDSCAFFFRIAHDSMNYYEIEVPVLESDHWSLVTVNFTDLTNLKINTADDLVEQMITDAIDPSREYMARLKGNPTLFKVRYLFSGLRNRSHHVLSDGEVWFNDLKLGGVRRDVDHAERTSFAANFANILQFNGSWQRTGPEFRTLRQKRGSGVTNSSLQLSTKSQINHFIPTLGFVLPISFKYGNSKSLPKYIPQSDVEISVDAVRDSLKSMNTSYSFNVSMSRRGSKNWFMKHLFDNMKSSFSYSKRSAFSPNSRDTSWTMSGNLNYNVSFRRTRQLGLFRGIKWRYWLSNFNFTSSGSRKVRHSYAYGADGFTKRPTTYESGLNNNLSTLYEPFESIKIDFNMREQRNLAIDRNWLGLPIGIQTDFNHNMRLKFQPKPDFFLIGQFNPRFEYGSRYNEDIRPSIRQDDDPEGTRNVSAQRNMNFVFDVDIGRYVVSLSRKAKIIGEDEEVQGSTRRSRSGASLEEKKKDFKKMLEESKKPKESSKAGKIESIFGDEPPPDVKEKEEPPPSPPTEADTDERKESEAEKKSDVPDLGIRRTQEETKREAEEEEKEKQEQAAKSDTTAPSKTDPRLLLKHLVRFIGRVDPIRTTIKLDHQNSYQRLYDRAAFLYQFGFSDESNVLGKSGDIENEPERATNTMMIDLRTGVQVTSKIDVDIMASIQKRQEEFEGSTSESDRITWPSLNVSISGMEKAAFLKRFIKQSDLRVKFERKSTSNIRRKEESYSLNPNWNLIWKNQLSTNFSFSFRHTKTTENRQEMWQRVWSVDYNMRYNFEGTKGFGIPLPFLRKKKIKFKSTLSTDLSIGYSNSSRYNQPSSNSLSISPRASYRFSNKIKGSISINYKRTAGGIYGYINHSVGLHVTAEFTF